MPFVLRPALFLALVLAVAGCDAVGGGDAATLNGQVVNAITNRPITGATIQVLSTGIEHVSDSLGSYSALVEVDSAMQVRVVAFKTGYLADTVTVAVEPGQEVTVPSLALALREGSTGDGTSGPAASITLSPNSPQSLGVTGTGSTETGSLVFVALDAAGNPVDAAHAVDIAVSILQGPGGGEFLNPAAPQTVRTDENGEAAVTLTSGTAAGVVQIETRATAGGREIRSQPISLVIHGGFPDQEHFAVAPDKRNFPGLVTLGLTNPILAIVGDRYGNPVQPGTQVYFTTSAGVIGGGAPTQATGEATVNLLSANPRPPGGFATITARTAGINGTPIEASTQVLFSGLPRITLDTPGLGLGTYTYTVDDENGNPLAEGTSITVTVDGENISTLGNLSVSLQDRMQSGFGTTRFSFTVRPGESEEDAPRVDRIEIAVTGPNGTATGSRPGNLLTGAPVVGKSR